MRVFILNGPPGVGKDTLAANLLGLFGFPTVEFKAALYRETAEYFNVDLDYFIGAATNRHTKEAPDLYLGGISPRQALIHVSEDIIKPKYGKKFFGLKAVETLRSLDGQAGTVVFSDGGFVEETECLIEHGFEVHIIQLHHKDFDFSKDSRDYVTVPEALVHHLDITMGAPMMDVGKFTYILERLNK
jgi:hypothetical protein